MLGLYSRFRTVKIILRKETISIKARYAISILQRLLILENASRGLGLKASRLDRTSSACGDFLFMVKMLSVSATYDVKSALVAFLKKLLKFMGLKALRLWLSMFFRNAMSNIKS